MSWLIGRNAAMADPARARAKVLAKLHMLAELDDPESLVVPILIDAVLLVESYRGARHQPTFLPELGKWLEVRMRYLSWVDGRLAQMVIATDITSRRLAEQQAALDGAHRSSQ